MGLPAIFYDNRLADASPVADSTATGYAVDNLTDWRSYNWWRPNAMPATVTVDCGSAKAADYMLLLGHDLGTQGVTVELRASTDNFAASDVLVDSATPSTDEPLLLLFNSASYRYWRLSFSGANPPSIAIAAIGAVMRLPVYMQQPFDPLGRDPKGEAVRSGGGHPLAKIINYEDWKQTINLKSVTWTWLRNTWLPAWRSHLRGTPFGFAWNPDDYPAELLLAETAGGFKTPHRGIYADLTFELEAVIA